MKLTCVTATFNVIKAGNRERLIRCVESVAKLKTEHEHLIYDGASADGTVELLRELEAKTPGLKVVSEPDTGIYNALNKGVRDANGEWFYVLGCDDYVCNPNVLDAILSLERDVSVIVTPVQQMTKNGVRIWFKNLNELDQIFCSPCVCHQGEIVRTELARKLNGFDEMYTIAADSDMLFRAHIENEKFVYLFDIFAYFEYGGCAVTHIEKALVEHRLSVANVLGLNASQRKKMIESKILPYCVLMRLFFHKDIAIRYSARRMLRLRLRLLFRLILFPIVIITRPIRHGVRR